MYDIRNSAIITILLIALALLACAAFAGNFKFADQNTPEPQSPSDWTSKTYHPNVPHQPEPFSVFRDIWDSLTGP